MELSHDQRQTLEVFTSKSGAFDVVHQIAKEYIEKKRDVYIKNTASLELDTNEEVGAKLKAFMEGLKLVEGLFREVAQYKKEEVMHQINRAR